MHTLFLSFLVIPWLALAAPAKTAAPAPSLIDATAVDPAVNPCTDFYTYACGSWLRRATMPPGYSSVSLAGTAIIERNQALLRTILEAYAQGHLDADVPFARQMGDFYAACMDTSGAERTQVRELPIKIAALEKLSDKRALAALYAGWMKEGVSALFDLGVQQDTLDATQEIVSLDPGGMPLGERVYYLSTAPDKTAIRRDYQAHVARMLALSGVPGPRSRAQAAVVVAIETELARHALEPAARRDPRAVYHPMDGAAVGKLAPDYDWTGFLQASGVPAGQKINVSEPEFLKGMSAVFRDRSLADLKTYVRWSLLHASAGILGQRLFDENFAFFSHRLRGTAEPFPRWKRCVSAVASAMGFALGEAYVRKTFTPQDRSDAVALIREIEKALAADLRDPEATPWMEDKAGGRSTRDHALAKLDLVVDMVGYPDHPRDYGSLNIGRTSHFENTLKAREFESNRQLAKLGKPVDRSEWEMIPSEVNAYYDPSLNEIVFPAAILQSPYYDRRAPPGQNYGSTGATMGHELTHGFDDQGRQYDGHGNLTQWWSPEVESHFKERAQCLVRQYGAYTVGTGTHLDGELTVGENIADLGGLKLAYRAWQSVQQKDATPEDVRQFFVAYAQSWCTKNTPASEDNRATEDPHAIEKYRVNGVVQNLPEFAAAFSCTSGAPMAPANRCSLW
jgi:endothelin-converting enzyme/putative endopeptidase